VIVISC